MKRMIPTSLITWVKLMFKNIGYSNSYRATQINGSLIATGSITSQSGGAVYADKFTRYGNTNQYTLEFNYDSIVLTSYTDAITINGSGVTLGTPTLVKGNLSLSSGKTFKIGSTTLTEDQLKKLIALIPAE